MYHAPIRELEFVLNELIGGDVYANCPADVAAAILAEAGRFAEQVLAPLNQSGDRDGARWTEAGVIAPPGFKEAYREFIAAGWPQLNAREQFGGQPIGRALTAAVEELWASANLSFKLCPMLTHSAVEALQLCGTPAQQALYLPKLVSGEWSGTMVLTEPQAGSDLGQVRSRAVPEGDQFRLMGQKIFITWGDHQMSDNIIHLVLARIEGAPAGVKGLSLFIVPKYLVRPDGAAGEPNDVQCTSIEEKLGIHASPTCAMSYGEQGGALAELIGKPGHGLEYMFIMMNAARLSVGLEGHALAERAFQRALDWAHNRVQGRGGSAIIQHPDVKRMLLVMKCSVQAMRALALFTAHELDSAEHGADEAKRLQAKRRGEMLIPIVKGWCTEYGQEIVSLGIQVHGGMGFIEETGAAQHLRDVRISAIYEGTTGIQGNDLLGRKLGLDQGATMMALLDTMTGELDRQKSGHPVPRLAAAASLESVGWLREATASILKAYGAERDNALAVSVPYMKLCGLVIAGWLMARAATVAAAAADGAEAGFYQGKLDSVCCYVGQVLPHAQALARIVCRGAGSVAQSDTALI
ncbi:MAG TPA: acyl-CoA dehydrogenase [Steroidobacteraceae bacterium]